MALTHTKSHTIQEISTDVDNKLHNTEVYCSQINNKSCVGSATQYGSKQLSQRIWHIGRILDYDVTLFEPNYKMLTFVGNHETIILGSRLCDKDRSYGFHNSLTR